MEKKGLNDAITTALFVVLVLISIAIIWYFVRPLIYSASEITTSGDCIELQIEPVSCVYLHAQGTPLIINNFGGDVYYVQSKRGAGSGSISGMRFVFEESNGKIHTYDWNTSDAYPFRISALPQPLDVVDNIFIDRQYWSPFTPVKVSVAPLLENKKTYCEPSGGFVECLPAVNYNVAADLSGPSYGRCDNGVDINDLLYFLESFENGSLGADIAPQPITDGQITPDDLFSFLVAFERGTGGNCPFAPN